MVETVLLVVVLLLFGGVPPIIDEIAAARAAVKFGSAVMAAVAAVRVSANEWCGVGGGWWPS